MGAKRRRKSHRQRKDTLAPPVPGQCHKTLGPSRTLHGTQFKTLFSRIVAYASFGARNLAIRVENERLKRPVAKIPIDFGFGKRNVAHISCVSKHFLCDKLVRWRKSGEMVGTLDLNKVRFGIGRDFRHCLEINNITLSALENPNRRLD